MVNNQVKVRRLDFLNNENKIRERIINELRKNPEGLTIIEVAGRLDISRQTSSRYMYGLISEGIVKFRKIGPAKLCYLKKWVRRSGG